MTAKTNSERQRIVDQCHAMRMGQCLRIYHEDQEHFHPGWRAYADNAREDLLNSLMGSGYGAFLINTDPMTGDWIVSRHEPGERRVYIEADRRDLFERTPDGFLEFVN